jgi:hypothetical protein
VPWVPGRNERGMTKINFHARAREGRQKTK